VLATGSNRQAVATRLRELLAVVDGEADRDEEVLTASDDDLFDILDNELGTL